MLSVQGFSKSMGRRVLWQDLNFTVDPGQMMAVRGASGSGKSTLLNCIALMEPVTSGTITIAGKDMTNSSRRARRLLLRDTLGYLFQNYALIEDATVADNLSIAGGRLRGHAAAAKRRSYDDVLDQVGMSGRANSKVYELSGGEQQRIALARLLLKKPDLILADEPTGALDDGNAGHVMDTLRTLANSGAAVVIATHSNVVQDQCDVTLNLELPVPVLA